jgi:thioredoxin-like negative regulator of GroEL
VVITFYSLKIEHLQEHSQRVLEEIDRLAVAVQDRIKFFSISLDEQPEALTQFGLQDIPSILIFREGYPRTYYGQRTGYTMYAFFSRVTLY